MLELTDYVLLSLFGAAGAFMAGFLGVGGGIIYIPVLDYFLQKAGLQNDLLVKAILANSLFTIIFSGTVASYKQYKLGNFYPKEILLTALPGIVVALGITYFIQTGTWYSKSIFNMVFACMLMLIVVKMLIPNKQVESNSKPSSSKFMGVGSIAGIITAFSGLGGGIVMTPLITDWLKQPIKKASAISNGVIPLFAVCIGFYNLFGVEVQKVAAGQFGLVVLPVVFPMILATFLFAPMGVSAAQKFKAATIRLVFALFVLLVLSRLLWQQFA
jgi:uncharacterized membrane protein YfcA